MEGLSAIISMSWRVWRRNGETFPRRFSRRKFMQNASTTLHQPKTLHLFAGNAGGDALEAGPKSLKTIQSITVLQITY